MSLVILVCESPHVHTMCIWHSFIYLFLNLILIDCYVIGFGSFCGKTKTQKVDRTELVPAVTCQKRDHTQQLFLISAVPASQVTYDVHHNGSSVKLPLALCQTPSVTGLSCQRLLFFVFKERRITDHKFFQIYGCIIVHTFILV